VWKKQANKGGGKATETEIIEIKQRMA